MSEKLPYFRFNAYSWLSDDIALEERTVKSVFIDICAYYWTKDCERTKEQIERRFRNNLTEVEAIFKVGLIKVDEDDFIEISFLNEQWDALLETREKLSKAGKKSVKVRRKKKRETTTVKDTQTHLKPTLKQPLNPPLNYNDKDKDYNNDKDIKPTVSALKKVDSFYQKMVGIYLEFIKNQTDLEHQFTAADGSALKKIITYLQKNVKAKIPNADKEQIEQQTLVAFEFIFTNWGKLKPFYQESIKLQQINSNMVNILAGLKSNKESNQKKETTKFM